VGAPGGDSGACAAVKVMHRARGKSGRSKDMWRRELRV
jgi:hypothetical protein